MMNVSPLPFCGTRCIRSRSHGCVRSLPHVTLSASRKKKNHALTAGVSVPLVRSRLAAVHITVLAFNYNIWLIYAPGIPGQIIIFLWSKLSFRH